MVEIQKGVIEKLILFSIAIVVVPLALLFLSLQGNFDCESQIEWIQNTFIQFLQLQVPKTTFLPGHQESQTLLLCAVAISIVFGSVTAYLRQVFGAVLAVMAVNLVGAPLPHTSV